jgi:hypothetical protein
MLQKLPLSEEKNTQDVVGCRGEGVEVKPMMESRMKSLLALE